MNTGANWVVVGVGVGVDVGEAGSLMVSVLTEGLPRTAPTRGRAQGECQRLARARVGEQRAGDVRCGLPDPKRQRTAGDSGIGDARGRAAPERQTARPSRLTSLMVLLPASVTYMRPATRARPTSR